MNEDRMVLMAGRKDDPFAQAVSRYLYMKLCKVTFTEFLDDGGPMSGETKVEIRQNIRGRDVYVLWSIGFTNYELIQVMQVIDAARLSGEARRIILVCPELPCARQDKTHERRESLSSRLVARLLERAGLDQILTADLHSDQIEGHFRIPLDHLRTKPIWAHFISERYQQWMDQCGLAERGRDLVLGVPDAGRARATRELSDEVGKTLRGGVGDKIKIKTAYHDKHRSWEVPGKTVTARFLGDVEGKVVWITDDLLSSGGTMFGAARAAKEAGAIHVVCSITHAHGFDKPARGGNPAVIFADQLKKSAIDELVVTDTHPRFVERVKADPELASRVTILSLVPMFGETIQRVRRGLTIKEMMIKEVDDVSTIYRVLHEATAKPMPCKKK